MVSLTIRYQCGTAAPGVRAGFALMLPGGSDESDYTLFERFPNPVDVQPEPAQRHHTFFGHEEHASTAMGVVLAAIEQVRREQRCLFDSAVSVLRALIARSPAIHVELSLPKGISNASLSSVFDVARLLAIDSATIRPFQLQIRCDASDEKLVREFGRSHGFGEAAIALREPG